MAPVANLSCGNCLKTFRNEQLMKTHRRMNSCKKKTFEEMEKENENLEAAIVIEDDDESHTLEENSTPSSLEELKKQSVAMADQVQHYLDKEKEGGPELTLSDENFTELSSKLSFDYNSSIRGAIARPLPTSLRPTPPSSQLFKRPHMVPPLKKTIARKKAVVGMLTGKACSYCNLEEPDYTSLAFHYVREHWEVVIEKQSKQGEGSGGRPRSKFHLSGTTGMQEEQVQMTMPTRPTSTTTYYPNQMRAGKQRANQGFVPKAGPYRPYMAGGRDFGPDASWMRKLEEKKTGSSYNEKMRRYREAIANSNANRKVLPIRPDQPACQICQVVFKSHGAAEQHNIVVHAGNMESCEVCDDDFNWPDASHSCPRTEKAKLELVSKSLEESYSVNKNVSNYPIPTNDLVLVVD